MKIPLFKEIDNQTLQSYYKLAIDFEGRALQLDLNFHNNSIDEGNLSQVKTILENLKEYVEKARGFINKEFQTGSAVDDYLDFFLEELFEEDFEILLKDADKTLSRREQIFSVLKLKRIGFYPEVKKHYAIFDFVADEESNQVLVVIFNKNGEFDHITWES